MKTTFVRFATEDNLLLQGLLYEPDEPTEQVVCHVHGMGGNFYDNRFIDQMAVLLTQSGYAFLTFNNRGHDSIADLPVMAETETYKRLGNAFELFEDCVLDVTAAVHFLKSHEYREIVLQGHSLGCSKVVYAYTQQRFSDVSRLVLLAPADMIGLAEMEVTHQESMLLARRMVGIGRAEELLPYPLFDWYYLSAKTYLDFHRPDNPINIFSTYDPERPSVLAEVTIPTLAIWGDNDDVLVVPVEQSLAILHQKAPDLPLTTGIIAGASHSYFGHETELATMVAQWLTT